MAEAWLDAHHNLVIAGAISGCILLCLCWFGERCAGKVVEACIESLDDRLFGVQVEIESMTFSPCRGRLVVKNLTLENPPGYNSKHALQIGRLVFDLNTAGLLRSLCSKKTLVHIEAFELVDLNVNVELYDMKPSFTNIDIIKCNVRDLLRTVTAKTGGSSRQEDPQESATLEEEDLAKPVVADEVAKELTKDLEQQQLVNGRAEGDDSAQVHVERLLVKDIRAKLSHRVMRDYGFTLAVADMDFTDFSTKYGDMSMLQVVSFISKTILTTVMRTLLTNVLGRHIAMANLNPRRCCSHEACV